MMPVFFTLSSVFTLSVAWLSFNSGEILPTDDPTLENVTAQMSIIANYSNISNITSKMSNSSMSYANTTDAVTTLTEQTDTESVATTPNPMTTTPTVRSLSTETGHNLKDKRLVTTAKPDSKSDSTGIIILVLIIVIAVGFALACYFVRRRGRSVDFSTVMGPDEATIPLGTLAPELAVDGLQTFQSDGKRAEEDDEEPDRLNPETEDRQPHAESASKAPPEDNSESKTKDDDDAEKDPLAPVEPAHKTSEGTPKEDQ
uniref:uncharacterized protein LOC131136981 isoform X2 n=1 Tax=Doryrhamphus excisus TaxID=161450 RepID=UPI0025ADBB87|nr:uncharacterized protein LOC131136981 isoform X2 [Doryrhamphus excisus]